MPRYTKDGGKYGYRRRYKKQPHEEIAKVVNNLSTRQFRIMQELAKHGMGLYTQFRDQLPTRPKKKVKPSSFEKYAQAKDQADLAQQILQEREEHADHTSETHVGGGLGDAHNAIGDWIYDLALDAGTRIMTEWAIDQLDPETSKDERDNVPAVEPPPEENIPNEEWIENLLDTANTVVDTVDWIGGILGSS